MYTLRKHSLAGTRVTHFQTLGELTEAVSERTCSECKTCYGTGLEEMLQSVCGSEFSMEGVTFTDSESGVYLAEHTLREAAL